MEKWILRCEIVSYTKTVNKQIDILQIIIHNTHLNPILSSSRQKSCKAQLKNEPSHSLQGRYLTM